MPDQLDLAAESVALSRTIFEQLQGGQSPNLGRVAELEQMLSEAESLRRMAGFPR